SPESTPGRATLVRFLSTLLALSALPVAAATGYLLVLTVKSRRREPPAYGAPRSRFAVVVPAHDEEAGIADTVRSVLAVDYPADLFEVVVVADNCTDDTAARATAAGARVLVQNDATKRGKGFALAHAFEALLGDVTEKKAEAVVDIDADTVVSPNLLRAFEARLVSGAGAVQADYA